MNLLQLIGEHKNICLAGGGGKTGLIEWLGSELQTAGRPTLTSLTTRLGRDQLAMLARVEAENPAQALAAVRRAISGERLLVAGPFQPDHIAHNKLAGLPPAWFPQLRAAAGEELVMLIEADGSAGRPFKCHRPYEPVIPPLDNFTIAVLGLSVLLLPWPQAVHRPEILKSAITCPPENRPLTPSMIAEFIAKHWARFKPDLIFLNQSDVIVDQNQANLARELGELLKLSGWSVAAGSVRNRRLWGW